VTKRIKVLLIAMALAVAAAIPALARAGSADQDAPHPDPTPSGVDEVSESTGTSGDDNASTAGSNESSDDDDDEDPNDKEIPITGPDLDRASEVAINHLGGGTVTETEIEGAKQACERLVATAAATSVEIDDGRVAFTVSIGVTAITSDVKDPSGLLKRADALLYQAKSAGRNRVVAAGPGTARSPEPGRG